MTPIRLLGAASMSGLVAAGGPAILGVVVLIEAGVPIPLPGDVVVLILGAQVATGGFPLWGALLGCEVAAAIGTGVLLLLAHGPGRALIRRLGPRVGLTQARLDHVDSILRRRGAPAVIVGRATPGLRTATVIAAGTSGLRLRWLFILLLAGSTIFELSHLLLGILLGPAAQYALSHAKVPLLIGAGVLLLGGLVFWALRHGRRSALSHWSHAACPACLVTGALQRQKPAPAGTLQPD